MCPCGGKLVVFREEGSRRTRCDKCGKVLTATNGTPAGDAEVVCIDNTGMEDKFDTGVSYLCEGEEAAGRFRGMMWVYDREGKAQLVFMERFKAA
jgi:hypothetical protein